MYFYVIGFSKDNVNTRKDLAALCNNSSLEPKRNAKGNLKRPHSSYCLKPAERKEMFRWLKKLKFPYRHASNIKWVVNVSSDKLNGLKSHDYHIIIERLMSVMFHGFFNADRWKIFVELIYFYRQICAKQVLKVMMQKLEKEIAVLYVRWKKYFHLDGSMRCNIC
jgi:hypothetical protein